jgi:hypothetical protein
LQLLATAQMPLSLGAGRARGKRHGTVHGNELCSSGKRLCGQDGYTEDAYLARAPWQHKDMQGQKRQSATPTCKDKSGNPLRRHAKTKAAIRYTDMQGPKRQSATPTWKDISGNPLHRLVELQASTPISLQGQAANLVLRQVHEHPQQC